MHVDVANLVRDATQLTDLSLNDAESVGKSMRPEEPEYMTPVNGISKFVGDYFLRW